MMKVVYDTATDTLTVLFRENGVADSDERSEGTVLDFDREGNLVGIEIQNASQRVEDPRTVVVTGS